MYFPIGCMKCYNSRQNDSEPLILVGLNRTKSLIVAVSKCSVNLWKAKPRLLLANWIREQADVLEFGENISAMLKPDSSKIFVMTNNKTIFLLDILTQDGENIYHLHSQSSNYIEQLDPDGIKEVSLTLRCRIELDSLISSYASRTEELVLATEDGCLHRIKWCGDIDNDLALNICNVPFSMDLETTSGITLGGNNLHLKAVECSPLLGGFAVVISDGRAGFLLSSTAEARPNEIVGVFAKEVTDATCLSINYKYQLIVFGCSNGQACAYTFDEYSGGLMLSHKYVLPARDYPDQAKKAGIVSSLCWTSDGCAMAMMWANGAIAVWSVFGALLVCTLNSDFCASQDVFSQDLLRIKSLAWGPEGYQLLLIPEIARTSNNLVNGDILQLSFVKSALTVNPCMPNRKHLFLQGESSLYVNSGDMILPNSDGSDQQHTSLFSNRHWQTVQVPSSYISINWPIRYSAIDWTGKNMAVAGKYGYAQFSLNTRKWKLFGNETQERSVTCRGGLTFWDEYLIVACYNITAETDEVRFHSWRSNFDVRFAQIMKLFSPVFMMNIFHDILLIYLANCRVCFYKLHLDETVSPAAVMPVELSEISLVDYVQHPLNVTSLSLTTLKNEQSSLHSSVEGLEANSLIVNVAGKILMLQKDRPAAERQGRKVEFLPPIVLASCVENLWYMLNIRSNKRHLSECLWLACGGQGMKAWLPLFPIKEGGRPLGFLSKRIMLHFELHVYPLAVLFEDAVILGIGTDSNSDSLSPVIVGNANLLSFYNLERATQVYLPHILRQLLRRNLGVHALEIARTCTNLPYFTHVLELMLHEVLEREATASEPIPDPLLPRIVAFIQEFPQFLETVCHCARKTEVALWRHLFSVAGNPIDLFKECCDSMKLETAASYLIIIQNLEHHSISRQHATLLLEAALDNDKWELAKDLVRFLTAIGKGDAESPPRTPQHKSFHPTILSEADDNDVTPVMVPIHKPPSRTNSLSSAQMGLPSPKDKASRPSSLKLTRCSTSVDDNFPTSRPVTVESCEQFFTDLILARHARKLLSSFRLRDLGRFAAHLHFNLTVWFTKERFRAAQIDDFLEALIVVHRQFEWAYPILSSGSEVSASRESSKISRRSSDPLCRFDDSISTTASSNINADENIADQITAKLASIKVDEENNTDAKLELSETSSVTPSIDYEIESYDGSSWVTEPPALVDLEQKAPLGSRKCERQLRHLLAIFVDARCIDWCIIISLLLDDLSSISQTLDKMVAFKDFTNSRLDMLIEQLHSLELWAEQNCPGYQFSISTIRASCEELCATITLHQPEKKPSPTMEKRLLKEEDMHPINSNMTIESNSEVEPIDETVPSTDKEDAYDCVIT